VVPILTIFSVNSSGEEVDSLVEDSVGVDSSFISTLEEEVNNNTVNTSSNNRKNRKLNLFFSKTLT
jgi:hypothetical protein